jgi:hypothetical protein
VQGLPTWQGHVSDFPRGITFRPDSKFGDPSVHFDHLEEIFNMVQSNV